MSYLDQRRRRCNAWCHGRQKRCKRWPVPGRTRCKHHGGASTGPRTAEGRAASYAARDAGKARYWAQLKASGEKPPSGRRKGMRDRRQMEQAMRKEPADIGAMLMQRFEYLKSRSELWTDKHSGQLVEIKQGNHTIEIQSAAYSRPQPTWKSK
jgi:hypothetical protein